MLLDCPPSLGLLTLNALAVAHEVIIPMQPHFLAMQGVAKLLETVQLVSRRMNSRLKVSGIVLTIFDAQTKLGNEVVSELKSFIRRRIGQIAPMVERDDLQEQDPTEHQARRIPRLRTDDHRLRSDKQRRSRLSSPRPRDPGDGAVGTRAGAARFGANHGVDQSCDRVNENRTRGSGPNRGRSGSPCNPKVNQI